MSEPAEGWYPDPNGAPHLRWWDGQAWTDYVEPYMEPTSSRVEPQPTRDEPARSGTRTWTLGAVASWSLVVIFIVVLVVAWSHLGASGRVHDEAKERARIAQQELDTAQSTLDDINRQIEEAQK